MLIGSSNWNSQSTGSRLLAHSGSQIEEGLGGANHSEWVSNWVIQSAGARLLARSNSRSNQHGWLIPTFLRSQAVGNLDPAVFSEETLQFEDFISLAGSSQNFFDCK
jgi:hypothetical protein